MLEWSDDPMDYLIDFRCDQKKALNLCDHKRIVRATILVIVKPFCWKEQQSHQKGELRLITGPETILLIKRGPKY